MTDLHWHYASGGQKHGPIEEVTLHELLASGTVSADALVWNRSMKAWTPASQVPAFADVANVPPPMPDTRPDLSAQAYSKAREASGHALDAFKILLSDPMGGQGKALAALGESKALSAGIVFLVAFVACGYAYGSSIPEAETRLILLGLGIAALALPVATLATGKIFGGDSKLNTATFTAGVALLPAAVFFLLLKLLGAGENWIFDLLLIFPFSMFVILLNAGLMDVHKLTTKKAFLLTPLLIAATMFIFAALFFSIKGSR